MQDLWRYKLIKVSKICIFYDVKYVKWTTTFMKSIHHVSEFTLMPQSSQEATQIDALTLDHLWDVYNWTFEQFELKNIKLSEEDCSKLGEAFNKNRNNLTLNLKSCCLDDTSIARLFKDLLSKPRILFLQYLSLADNSIKDKGCQIITVCLPYFEYLNVLDLRKNMIGDHGVKSLSKGFKYMPQVVQIYLSDNMVTKKGFNWILSHLHYLKSIVNFDLSNNSLKDDGVEMAVKAVAPMRREILLNVKNNKVKDLERIKDIIEEEENKKARIASIKVLVE